MYQSFLSHDDIKALTPGVSRPFLPTSLWRSPTASSNPIEVRGSYSCRSFVVAGITLASTATLSRTPFISYINSRSNRTWGSSKPDLWRQAI